MKYKVSTRNDEAQIFETVQGEGAFLGAPAFFIRLQGCSVGCYFCDEKESWKHDKNFQEFSSEEIIIKLKEMNHQLKRVVITGGEPTEQDLSDLISKLVKEGYRVHIETAATGEFTEALFKSYEDNEGTEQRAWITCSPKELYSKKLAHENVWNECAELKFVVSNEDSEKYIKDVILEKYRKSGLIYLTPDWFDFDANKERVMKLVSVHPERLRAGIQAHKYLEIA